MNALENKIPPPVVMILFGLMMWVISRIGLRVELSQMWAFLLAATPFLMGIAFAGTGMRQFQAASTTVNPLKPEEASSLVETGVYQITRNPMYVGLSLILVSWGILRQS